MTTFEYSDCCGYGVTSGYESRAIYGDDRPRCWRCEKVCGVVRTDADPRGASRDPGLMFSLDDAGIDGAE